MCAGLLSTRGCCRYMRATRGNTSRACVTSPSWCASRGGQIEDGHACANSQLVAKLGKKDSDALLHNDVAVMDLAGQIRGPATAHTTRSTHSWPCRYCHAQTNCVREGNGRMHKGLDCSTTGHSIMRPRSHPHRSALAPYGSHKGGKKGQK
jgi:hypothetical protein